MSAPDPRTPCLIGVAQETWHLAGDELAPEPLEMWVRMARAAAADSGATTDVLGAVGAIDVVYCMSWPYDDPGERLAEALSISPAHTRTSGIGGTVPQQLLAERAQQMLAGELDVALLVGAEALDTKRRLKKAGERPAWSFRDPEPPAFPFEAPFHPTEISHEVFQAWLTFAVRDVARRAHLGVDPAAHREAIGALLAPMTKVAAQNPNAWFPQEQTAEALIRPSADNRLVGYPYTKRTVAIMDVDMASAAILATHEAADRLGVPADRRVYLRGWGYATDAVYVAEHPDLWRSPAMGAATAAALATAGVATDDLGHLDLYSCFASSVAFALDALGMTQDDERGVTVTGGLPFAGGPASNYLGHAVASMVGRLRDDPGSIGLVTGVGMHMTKHSAVVYSNTPGPIRPTGVAAPEPATRSIADSHDGAARVAAYSVVHGRSGDAEWGLAICDVDDATRCYARVEDAGILASMEAEEWVGRAVQLRSDGGVNRIL